jgi:hypothetical protein
MPNLCQPHVEVFRNRHPPPGSLRAWRGLRRNATQDRAAPGNSFVEDPLWNIGQVTQMPQKPNPTPEHSDGPRTYPGNKARQGDIVLRKPWMRVVFIAGLVGCVLLVLIFRIIAGR